MWSSVPLMVKVGDSSKAPINFLIKAVKIYKGALKKRSVQGLASLDLTTLGSSAKPAFIEMINALNDDEARMDAKTALVKIGKFAADSIALAMINGNKDIRLNEAARLSFIEALGEIGQQSPTIGRALTTIYRGDTSEENKKAALRVYEKLTGKKTNVPGPGGPGPGR